MNSVKLISCTQINPALTANSVENISDLKYLFNGKSTDQEAIIEFAARVCYRSTEKMGHAPDFIKARVREGHEDIVEHIWATIEIVDDEGINQYLHLSKYCNTLISGKNKVFVGANLRTWLNLCKINMPFEVGNLLSSVAPSLFESKNTNLSVPEKRVSLAKREIEKLMPSTSGQIRVTLLGFSQPFHIRANPHCTFLIEGISRACTHQLVRHRLGSFSQESQRYVDLEKGKWNAIVPPSILDNQEASEIFNEFWKFSEEKYRQLRDLGIRKEDARFLLPNAAETRIVVSMDNQAISHFFQQRLDSAAQWEIREVAKLMENFHNTTLLI